MTEGNYYYNITNKRCFIKLVGHVHYSNSAGFEQFVADIINKGIIDNILIDLSETTGIDSTNLGLVAKLANYTISSHKKKITLITANPDVTTILDSMGFFEVSVIVEELPNGNYELDEIDNISQDQQDMTKMMLDAHKELIKVSEQNKDIFKNIVDMLQKEVDKNE